MGLHNDGGRNNVAAACAALDADVLALQEAWWWGEDDSTMVDEIATAVGGTAYAYTSPQRLDKHPARWTVAIVSRLPADRLDDRMIPSIRGTERALVRIRLRENDVVLAAGHFDGVHALRRNPLTWWRQRRALQALAPTHQLIAADCNMWGPVVARDFRPLRRAVRGPTWPAWRPHSQIDHLLIDHRLEVLDSQVLGDMGSDHLPVVATLRTRP